MSKNITAFLLPLFCFFILALSLRGSLGNLTETTLNQPIWREEGPLELSPERGKFALTFSLAEDQSFQFSLPVARFATPDLGYIHGKYVSLFAPGISFLTLPGYLVGKYFNLAQVGTYAVISLFAVLNTILIRKLAIQLGAHPVAATLAALAFLFATPAFAYAVSLYQHHVSTFILLLTIYLLLRHKTFFSLGLIWFLLALSLAIDYPNFFLLFPVAVFAVPQIITLKKVKREISLTIKVKLLPSLLLAGLPLLFFFWFNYASYGNPIQLAGTVPGVKAIDAQGKPAAPETELNRRQEIFTDPEKQQKSAIGFFKTRNLLHGLQTHITSADRGLIFFTPVVLLGLMGAYYLYKNQPRTAALFISVIGVNIVLYSMWGDPYGGWAFGSRYLIPSYALLTVLVALFLSRSQKNIGLLLVFLLLGTYSIWVNTAGALTSNANPPKVEALALQELSGRIERYGYDRNLELLDNNRSKSLVFTEFGYRYLTAWNYHTIIFGLIAGVLWLATFTWALAPMLSNQIDRLIKRLT